MIVIVGLVVLLAAVIVGFIGVLSNAGAAHPLTENFAVFGYHITGRPARCSSLGSWSARWRCSDCAVLLAGARRTAGRGRDARHELKRSQREEAAVAEPGPRPTPRTAPAGRRGHRPTGEPGARRRPRAAAGFPCSVAGRVVDNRRAPRMSTAPGSHRTRSMLSARSRGP